MKRFALSVALLFAFTVNAFGAYTEFCCRSGGSNLSAGSRNGGSTEPGTSPDFTYASGTWVNATGVFTLASGNPVTDGVAVGDFASVFPDAATVTPFVGRVTARDATTISVSLTAKAGTAPPDGTTNTTLRIGGAWKGPNGAVNFPFGFIENTLTNSSGDFPRINFKNDASFTVSAAVAHANAGPTRWMGYTTTYGDGGKWTLDANGGNFVILTLSGANNSFIDAIITNNATGSVSGFTVSGAECLITRTVVNTVRNSGFVVSGTDCQLKECEAYGCNTGNSASHAGFTFSTNTGIRAIRCISHDNLNQGFRTTVASIYERCVADTNTADGFFLSTNNSGTLQNCDAYNNGGDGVDLGNGTAAIFTLESCNFVKNGGWGINGSGAGSRNGSVVKCGFGSGTQVNTSGDATGLSAMFFDTAVDKIVYAADSTPWMDPANGDFRVSLAAAKGTGRGGFTQTQTGYSGTTSAPNIGASISNTVYRIIRRF